MADKPIDNENKPQTTLTNDEIVTDPTMGRRSVLTAIGATALGAVATATAGCFASAPPPMATATYVQQPVQTGITDRDPSDGAGQGRGGGQVVVVQQGRSGITDADPGDGAGNGRGGYRGVTGVTDGDSTPGSTDPGGNGRGAPTGMNTGMTDGDSGHYSDPGGGGRGPHH